MPAKQSAANNERPQRVFLIDSMSHIFRAFYAPMQNRAAPLATSQGFVTQAVYIFTNMLLKLLREEQPDYIAAIFESREKTFRHETFADYKANRLEMPDDLAKQMPYILRLCEAFNIPVINSPGYEADDVIGALATQVAEKEMQAVIVSNDKDMCQLVRDPFIVCMRQNSQVVKRKEPVPPIEWCDEAWVENKFGVTADKLVDLLGLMGDSIDNIPGAPGIGSKGAVQIIQQFGSIEAALAGWESVKHKTYRESLRDNADLIRQSRELARIQSRSRHAAESRRDQNASTGSRRGLRTVSRTGIRCSDAEYADAAGPASGRGRNRAQLQYRSDRRAISTISCERCSTLRASALLSPIQRLPERASRNVSLNYKRLAESRSRLKQELRLT